MDALLALLQIVGFWGAVFGGFALLRARQVRRETAEALRPENRLRGARESVAMAERSLAEAQKCGWHEELPRRTEWLEQQQARLEALETEFPAAAERAKTEELAQRERKAGASGG